MSEDIKQILSDYRMWMKSGDQGEASISIEDIDGEETFGAALDEILRLETVVERLKASFPQIWLRTLLGAMTIHLLGSPRHE